MSNFNHYPDPTLNSAIKKAWYRLMPLMFIMYFVAFIDRINVGFAKDAMSADIGLSQSAFALGAGIFFAAYALFGIPANLMMNKLGAKVWLSSTTVVWGLLSAGTGLVSNEYQLLSYAFYWVSLKRVSILAYSYWRRFISLTRSGPRSLVSSSLVSPRLLHWGRPFLAHYWICRAF